MPDFKMPEDQQEQHQGFDNSVVVGSGEGEMLSRKAYLTLALVLFIVMGGVTYLFARNNINTTTSVAPSAAASILGSSKIPVAQVNITSSGFDPASITVSKGQAVLWVNLDTKDHQIASDPYPTDNTLSDLNSVRHLSPNDSYTYIFNTPGTYTYHDDLNPSMEGTVVVNP